MKIVRSSEEIKLDLSSANTYTRAVAIVENHIASLPEEEHAMARQNIPYLLQFYPSILQLRPNRELLPYVNPDLKRSGLTGYSKDKMHKGFDDHRMLSYQLIESKLLENNEALEKIVGKFGYPCVVKPDEGERSSGVKVLENKTQFTIRHSKIIKENSKSTMGYLIQEYCDYKEEYGLQFYRIAGGFEIQLAQKNIPYVNGDNTHTLAQLIDTSPYKENYKIIFQKENKQHLSEIIPRGRTFLLTKKVTIAHGTTFSRVSLSSQQQKQLSGYLHIILKQKPDLYVGRFDLKAKSLEELLSGKFKIIECNGVGGIPLHVYDEKKSILEKYELLKKHYTIVTDIALRNKEHYTNIKPMSGSEWIRFWRDCFQSMQTKDVSISQKAIPQILMILYTTMIGKCKRVFS